MNTLRRGGFSLVEIIVVVAILALLAGMISYNFARPELRRQAVRTAAEELAATFRKARSIAMERKSVHAVVFHIQNQPGSSGIVLNNRSGGHWYRILGPSPASVVDRVQTQDGLPALANAGYSYKPHNIFETEEVINRAWVEDPHILSPGKVRFLALSDMDWGDGVAYGSYRSLPTTNYYPRPWFGWYDTSTKRLFPWGGFDPAIAGSGFFYWGTSRSRSGNAIATADPVPVGSMNMVDRVLDHWSVGQSNMTWDQQPIPSNPNTDILYKANTPRPLVNANWRDCSIVFLGNGQVCWGGWMPSRHGSWMLDGITKGTATPFKRGIYDRSNGVEGSYDGTGISQHSAAEASNFDQDSGGWFITLSPDVDVDNDSFSTAKAALDSISPMYRVFISRIGEVKIITVSSKADFNGLAAWPPTAAWWRTASNLQQYFGMDRSVDGTVKDGWGAGIGAVRGTPITSFVTPDMLMGRQVWMQ